MLRLHQLELSLDDAATFDPSCLRRLCAQRLHLSEKAVAEARLVKRSVDARSRGGVHFSLTADVALAQGGEAEEKRLASRWGKVGTLDRSASQAGRSGTARRKPFIRVPLGKIKGLFQWRRKASFDLIQ